MREFKRTAMGLWVICALLGSLSVAAAPNATDMVKQITNRMLSALIKQRAQIERDPTRIYGLVNRILVPRFDFGRITRAAVGGKHWRKASATQQRDLIRGFRELLVRTYSKALLNYSGQEIRYLGEAPGRSSTTVVSAEVREAGAAPIPIQYKLHRKSGRWKIFDVKIDGVSLVRNYRGSFDSQIRRRGIDGLIERLGEMNAQGKR